MVDIPASYVKLIRGYWKVSEGFFSWLILGELFGGKYFDRLLEVGGPGYDEGGGRGVGGG